MIRFLCLLLLSLGWAAARAGAPELRVSAADNFVIDATINGQAVRLRVDPETSGYVILNPATVERIGLRRSMIGSRTQIGPVRLQGWSKVAELRIGGVTEDRRMVWIDRPAIEGADGLIGPADLPYDQIIFDIREVAEHEEAGFPVPLEFDRSGGLYYAFRLGEDMMRVQFSLIKPISLATAAAGARLADLFEGHWIGEPQEQMIEFGVSRQYAT